MDLACLLHCDFGPKTPDIIVWYDPGTHIPGPIRDLGGASEAQAQILDFEFLKSTAKHMPISMEDKVAHDKGQTLGPPLPKIIMLPEIRVCHGVSCRHEWP
jgi:hypothetical protein